MAFVVGNKAFSSLGDAQAYLDSLQEFGGGGSITPFDTSLLTGRNNMPTFDSSDRSRNIEQEIEAIKRAFGQTGVGGGRALTSTIPTNFDLGRTRAPNPSQMVIRAPSDNDRDVEVVPFDNSINPNTSYFDDIQFGAGVTGTPIDLSEDQLKLIQDGYLDITGASFGPDSDLMGDVFTNTFDFNELEGDTPEFVNNLPGFALEAYWQALAADERQYGESAEYVRQFYGFISDLHGMINDAIANGEDTISRGDLFQAYQDNPELAAETEAFFDSLFGEDGVASVEDLINNDAFMGAVENYGNLANYYDFAAGYRDLSGFDDLRTDEEGRYIVPDTLEQLMQGIGQAEIESIWADPSIIEILTANGIRMNPDAPYDIGAAEGVTPEGFSELLEQIQEIQDAGGYEAWLESQGNEDTDAGGDQEGGTLGDTLSGWWEDLLDTIGGATTPGSSTPPTLPGSVGVIIDPAATGQSWPDILSSPGGWQVFLPGVIPNLPESPTIIGTIEDILNAPGEVLGDLWDDLVNTVSNPEEVLRGILEGAMDEDGLIGVGVMGAIVGGVYDWINDNGGTVTNQPSEEVLGLGGDGDDDVLIGGGNDDDPVDPEVGGGGINVAFGGGGGGSGRRGGQRGKDYMYRLQYNPDAPMSVPGMMGGTLGQQATRKRAPELGKPTMVEGLLTSFRRA